MLTTTVADQSGTQVTRSTEKQFQCRPKGLPSSILNGRDEVYSAVCTRHAGTKATLEGIRFRYLQSKTYSSKSRKTKGCGMFTAFSSSPHSRKTRTRSFATRTETKRPCLIGLIRDTETSWSLLAGKISGRAQTGQSAGSISPLMPAESLPRF